MVLLTREQGPAFPAVCETCVYVQDEPVDRGHSAETGTGSSSESGAEKASEQQQTPPPPVNSQPPEVEAQVVVKVEDPPPALDSPHKSAR